MYERMKVNKQNNDYRTLILENERKLKYIPRETS